MNRTLVVLALVAGLVTCTTGFSPEALDPMVEGGAPNQDDPEGRLLFLNTNTTSVTVGYSSFILGITSILVLGALIALTYFYATGDTYNSSPYSSTGYTDDSASSYGRKAYVKSILSGYC